MKNQIITERYLSAGGGIMDEGSEAYICFKRGGMQHWIYAVVDKLCERTVWIRPKYNSSESDRFRVYPSEIIKITDKDVPEEYVDRLLSGEIITVSGQKEQI